MSDAAADLPDDSGVADDPNGSAVTVSEIIDLERSQIGHDLHDLLLPLIFAASANLQSVLDRTRSDMASEGLQLDASAVKRLKESHDWMRQALSLGRNLLTEIYPAELDSLTWLAAAKDTAKRICGDACELIWIVDPASPICDPKWEREVAATAYRILVESLRNATRHGQATKVTLYCQPNRLMIVDDGIGFDPHAVPANHFGIRAMKGRAKLIGKTLTLSSRPGGPTEVVLTL